MNGLKKKENLQRKIVKRKTGNPAETTVTTALYCFRFWGTPGWLKVTYDIIILKHTQRLKMLIKHSTWCCM